jgi:hypothetical protein
MSKGQNLRINKHKDDSSYVEMTVGYRGTTTFQGNNHWYDYFGYGVSSGNYLKSDEVLYAAGAPRARMLRGEVVIFSISEKTDPGVNTAKRDINVRAELYPPEQAFGSYFGSVLLSLDLNDDGRDELLVGAPLFTIVKGSKSKRSPAESNDVKEDDEVSGEDGDEIKPEWTGDHGCVFIYSFDENQSPEKEVSLTNNFSKSLGFL